jgi:xylulokinase
MRKTVLGLDASTQSMTGVLLDPESGAVLWQKSLPFRDDPRLSGFGFEHDTMIIPAREPGEAEQPPRLFLAALDALLSDLKSSGADMAAVKAINTSGQQHGHVYLNGRAEADFAALKTADGSGPGLAERLAASFAYGGAPIWKTANTKAESERIRQSAGGKDAVIRLSGSDIPLRFSACAQRKVALRYPEAWAATRHLVQISSLVPAVLAGDATIPIDFGNACGTGLMNYRQRVWDATLMEATAGDLPGGSAALAGKLPPIVHPLASVGTLAAWFQRRYGLPADCRIIAGSGDNPQSKVLAEGSLLSLGTSFVYMLDSPDGGVDASGAANAMYDGLGRPFNFVCRTNGALAWDRLRASHGKPPKDYASAEAALAAVAPGSVMRFWHPDAESFPRAAAHDGVVRKDQAPADFAHDYAGAVDSALGLVYRYGAKIGGSADKAPMSVCGGPSASPGIMRRIAAIWNRPVIQAGAAGAAAGAAVAAAVALAPEAQRPAVAARLRQAQLDGCPVTQPDPALVAAYHGAKGSGGWLDHLEAAFEELRRA